MKSKFSPRFLPLIAAFCPILATDVDAAITAIPLALETAYTQNFDSPKLVNSGTGTALNMETSLPGWTFAEVPSSNTTYAANDGSNATGDTWSYGSSIVAERADRAFGILRDANVVSTFGAVFTRNFAAGDLEIYLRITYTGEQWRYGAPTSGVDKLDFQFSNDATSLTTGTWTNFDDLDFTSRVTTGTARALNGNLTENQLAVSSAVDITVSVANGANFWIRWQDFNATGTDDGLAVDNFSITALPEPSTTTLFGALGVAMLLRRRR